MSQAEFVERTACIGCGSQELVQLSAEIHPLEHINGFTPETMRGLAQRLGFEPVSVPTSHVTCDPLRVTKSEVKRIIAPLMRTSTQQYFRKL
jgi:hypothetical protein